MAKDKKWMTFLYFAQIDIRFLRNIIVETMHASSSPRQVSK